MASINSKCFEIGCLCANCKYICSRCMITQTDCANGKKECEYRKVLPYNEYFKENVQSGISNITEEKYLMSK